MSTLAEEVIDYLKGEMNRVHDAGYQKGVSETDGYGVGYNDGQADFGIQNEVTGTNIVTCDYVNENEHEIEVKLSSDTVTDFSGVEVKCVGKNLFDVEYTKNKDNWIIQNGGYSSLPLPFLQVGHAYTIGMSENNMYKDYKNEYNSAFAVYISTTPHSPTGVALGNSGTISYVNTEKQLTITENTLYYMNVFVSGVIGGFEKGLNIMFDELLKDFQIETSPAKTDYEPYTEKTYTANADGTLTIPSISPVMNIICEGVDISAKYYCVPDVELHRFWDEITNYGQRTDYTMAFRMWGMKIFDPPYKISIPTKDANLLFFSCRHLEEINGKKLDLSLCEQYGQFCHNCTSLKYFPDVNIKPVNISNAFNNCRKLRYFEAFDFSRVTNANNAFSEMYELEEFREIRGTINISLNFRWSPLLSDASVQSIIDCLADLTGQTSQTLTVHADVEARMTEEQKATITSKNWTLA